MKNWQFAVFVGLLSVIIALLHAETSWYWIAVALISALVAIGYLIAGK